MRLISFCTSLGILAVFLLCTWTFAEENHGIKWADSYEDALKQANKEQKLVMMVLGGGSCVACVRLKNQTLTDETIVKESGAFVSVYVDIGLEPALGNKYAPRGIPMTVFMDGSGNIAMNLRGYVAPPLFLAAMRTATANRLDLEIMATLEKKMQGGGASANEMAALGGLYNRTRQDDRAMRMLLQAQQHLDELDPLVVTGLELDLLIVHLPWEGGAMIRHFEKWLDENPQHGRHLEAMYYGGYAYAMDGQGEKALQMWQKVLEANADSPLGLMAKAHSETISKAMTQENKVCIDCDNP